MQVSKYNFLYHEKNEYFLFNIYSGAFYEITTGLYSAIENKDVEWLVSSEWKEQLIQDTILVENDEDILASLRIENYLKRTLQNVLSLPTDPLVYKKKLSL